jgi:two-component system, NtrC family, response regulator AtoC
MEQFDVHMAQAAALVEQGSAPPPRRARPRGGVLVVSASLGTELRHELARQGFDVNTASDAASALTFADACQPQAIVIDLAGSGDAAARLLRRLRRAEHRVAAIVLMAAGAGGRSGSNSSSSANSSASANASAMAAVGEGAVLLPWPAARARLPLLLDRGIAELRHAGELAYYRQREARHAGMDDLVGESTPMLRLKMRLRLLLDDEAREAAQTPPALLLQGEPGTGKHQVARALHFEGGRRNAPFVCVEADDLAAGDIEAALFGFEQGARERHRGLIEAADGGTLYLGEIGALQPALQERLADWLERSTLRRVGGKSDIAVDVRLVAATRSGASRSSPATCLSPRLLRLLSGAQSSAQVGAQGSTQVSTLVGTSLSLPPLRERGADLDRLAQHFIERQAARDGVTPPTLSRSARALLARHPWPGNVRELRQAIERAVRRQCGGVIGGEQIALDAGDPPARHESAADLELRQLEHDAMQSALLRARGNVCHAARLLGISRDKMRYRMRQHGLARHTPAWLAAEVI